MYGPGQLLLASKKPKIINLIRSIETMTIEEIKKLPEKPDIIRGLIEIKEFGDQGKGTMAWIIANKMQQGRAFEREKTLPIWQYNGDSCWLKTGKSEIQILPTWYWQEIDTNTVCISSNNVTVTGSILSRLKKDSEYIKTGTRFDLIDLEKSRVSKLI